MVVVVALSLRSPSRSGLHTHTQTFGVAERLLLLLLPQMACVDMDAADAAVSEWCRIGSSPMCCVGVRLAPLLDAARNHKSTSTSLRVPQLPFPQPNLIYNTHTHARRTHTHTHTITDRAKHMAKAPSLAFTNYFRYSILYLYLCIWTNIFFSFLSAVVAMAVYIVLGCRVICPRLSSWGYGI